MSKTNQRGTGRRTLLKGVVLGAATFTLVFAAASALAGTGVGGIFNLGKLNTVNATSTLGGTTAGAQLKVSNTSTAATGVGAYGQSKSATGAGIQGVNTAGGPGLQAIVKNNTVAPLKVNSTHVVPGLNAAMLGGLSPSTFARGGGTIVSRHATLSVGTTFATLLPLPGIGKLQVSCMTGPQTYWNWVDDAFHAFDATWQIEGGGVSVQHGNVGFTTSTTATNRAQSLVLDDSTQATGPVSVVRLWEFPSSPDSSHCFFQAAATIQP